MTAVCAKPDHMAYAIKLRCAEGLRAASTRKNSQRRQAIGAPPKRMRRLRRLSAPCPRPLPPPSPYLGAGDVVALDRRWRCRRCRRLRERRFRDRSVEVGGTSGFVREGGEDRNAD